MPLRNALARTIGLNDDPGWRSACVARLNWLRLKFVPPNIALTLPVRGSIATSAAAGPFESVEDLLDRLARLFLEVEVDRRRHLEPAAEHAVGAVGRDKLVGHVVDEVRRGPARTGKPDVLGRGSGAATARAYSVRLILPWSKSSPRTWSRRARAAPGRWTGS